MMTNIENLYSYTTAQYEAVDHLLTMGVGAHFAALVFFLLMSRFVAPNFLAATALSCIVMVSAGLILYSQADLWNQSFRWDGQTYALADHTFTNGYRYVNWMVTIPCLLTQLLIILGIRGRQLVGDATKLILAAWGMIITGYIGQLYETTDMSLLLIWGAISTVFFVYMNYIVGMLIFKTLPTLPTLPHAIAPLFRRIFWLMMFAWTLYPIAYLIPWLADSADSIVLRQGLFTLADVSSKVVYGLMITYVAIRRSATEDFAPAVQMLKTARSYVNQKVNA